LLFLREEHEEGKHEGEEADSFSQGEAKNGVVEEHAGEVGLAGDGDEEVAEDGSDTETDTSEGDGGETSADEVETLDGDGDGGGGARSNSDDRGGGSDGSANRDGSLGSDTAEHFDFFSF
jgi:hypothetical protein